MIEKMPKPTSEKFEIKWHGRSGEIIIRENSKSLVLYIELSGTKEKDFLLAPLRLKEWKLPIEEQISKKDQHRILGELRLWLSNKRMRCELSLSDDQQEVLLGQNCEWHGCKNFRIKYSIYCLYHFDETLLVT